MSAFVFSVISVKAKTQKVVPDDQMNFALLLVMVVVTAVVEGMGTQGRVVRSGKRDGASASGCAWILTLCVAITAKTNTARTNKLTNCFSIHQKCVCGYNGKDRHIPQRLTLQLLFLTFSLCLSI